MPYFDASDASHRDLLPEQYRKRGELSTLAARVEAEVIEAYTVSLDPTADSIPTGAVSVGTLGDLTDYVCLRGYAADATQADAGLADRLRREIADAIAWTFPSQGQNHTVRYTLDKDNAKTFGVPLRTRPGFGSWLRRYDVRPRAWVV